MESTLFDFDGFTDCCERNDVAPASLGKYLCGDTEIRDRLATGRIGLWKVELLTRFMHCHPDVPARGLRKTVQAFLADQRQDEERGKLEAPDSAINRETSSVCTEGVTP